ncbi:hypothetical protein [Bdellovibrio sp. HCB337]|uniref:hypothetical protein n=1 Tax=Bdellovibrio sp. HCB337 TaxID=3394358 RepID=UPI0039A7007A
MKNIFAKLMMSVLLTLSLNVFAHEGHDHDGPTNVQAPKGGVIKGLEETYVEVVSKGKDVKIYLYDKELKPQDVTKYKVSAEAELPKAKKKEPVTLTSKGTHFEASFDAKGAHRYTLIVSVVDPKTGHDDSLKFTVEPRK